MRQLTGKFFFRRRFFGGFDVMVEEVVHGYDDHDGTADPEYKVWRRASEVDLHKLNLQPKKRRA